MCPTSGNQLANLPYSRWKLCACEEWGSPVCSDGIFFQDTVSQRHKTKPNPSWRTVCWGWHHYCGQVEGMSRRDEFWSPRVSVESLGKHMKPITWLHLRIRTLIAGGARRWDIYFSQYPLFIFGDVSYIHIFAIQKVGQKYHWPWKLYGTSLCFPSTSVPATCCSACSLWPWWLEKLALNLGSL